MTNIIWIAKEIKLMSVDELTASLECEVVMQTPEDDEAESSAKEIVELRNEYHANQF